jgi:hypothetical protein
MLHQKIVSKPLAKQDVTLLGVMTNEPFATTEPLMEHARMAITTQLTTYATQYRLVRQTNSNSKMSVGPVLLDAVPVERQTH